MLLEKTEYDIIARKLESDLNERFVRVHWKVGGYDERVLCAMNSKEWWATASPEDTMGFAMTPEEAFESSMDVFRVNFSIQIEGEILMGNTEMDRRLITDPSIDAIPYIGKMVCREVAELLLVE